MKRVDSNRFCIIRFRTGYKYFNNYELYANVVYDSVTYNMASATLTAESNSKWRYCQLMYRLFYNEIFNYC